MSGVEAEVTIKSRVRLARNLKDIPFPFKLNGQGRRSIIQQIIHSVAEKNDLNLPFEVFDMGQLDGITKQNLLEKHLISSEFLRENRPAALLKTRDDRISIMINEEDHLRIQCFCDGLDLQATMKICMDVESWLEKQHPFSFHPSYGYLTSCPTNIGTGLRASVMLHLPALVMTGAIHQVMQGVFNLGLTARGAYGENSKFSGNMFQISNQKTLGQTEESIVNNVNNIAMQIIDQEKMVRKSLYHQNKYKLEDKIMRSYGTLKEARIISSEEAIRLLSDVHLGVDMGLIQNLTKEQIYILLVHVHAGSLQKMVGRNIPSDQRDIYRGEIIRSIFNEDSR